MRARVRQALHMASNALHLFVLVVGFVAGIMWVGLCCLLLMRK